MGDVVLGIVALAVGAMFCFRGYLAMRVIIPIWGAFVGFMLGAGLVASFTNEGFLGSLLAWLVGPGAAIVFAALAYLYYEVSVLLGMSSIGFVIGTSIMGALGVRWSWLIVLVGVLAGLGLAMVALVGDLPMTLLTFLTALAGAATVVTGLLLLVDVVSVSDFTSGTTTQRLGDDWWWTAIFVGLAVVGIVAQLRHTARRRTSLRRVWAQSGGHQMRPA